MELANSELNERVDIWVDKFKAAKSVLLRISISFSAVKIGLKLTFAVGDAIDLFRDIDRVNQTFVDCVIHESELYDDSLFHRIKDSYRNWIELAENVLGCCDRFQSVAIKIMGRDELRCLLVHARELEKDDFDTYAIQQGNRIAPTNEDLLHLAQQSLKK